VPNVIGDAGLVFAEEDVPALAAHLHALRDDGALRADLAVRGRARVLERFTQRQVAAETVAVYQAVMKGPHRLTTN
jgi:glycosyltransferase involved in cell wall biosynthesis